MKAYHNTDAGILSLLDELDRLSTVALLDIVVELSAAPCEVQEIGWTRYEAASVALLRRVEALQGIDGHDAWMVLKLSGYRLAFDRPPREVAA